ncbi:hypothetical protein D3C86_1687980 [compost metagenome]
MVECELQSLVQAIRHPLSGPCAVILRLDELLDLAGGLIDEREHATHGVLPEDSGDGSRLLGIRHAVQILAELRDDIRQREQLPLGILDADAELRHDRRGLIRWLDQCVHHAPEGHTSLLAIDHLVTEHRQDAGDLGELQARSLRDRRNVPH